jgi:ATP-dependent Clp protease protease subunit
MSRRSALGSKSVTDALLDDYLDIKGRSFLLVGDVDADMTTHCWKCLKALGETKPITIYINSGGGDVAQGFAIYDMIRNVDVEVTITVLGTAYSMAGIILQAADVRAVYNHSSVMIHDGSREYASNHKQTIKAWFDAENKLDISTNIILADKMGIPKKSIDKQFVHDKIYIGQEAIDAKLADIIVL